MKFHGLRHAYASLSLLAGIDSKVVNESLGHSTISITMDLYSHVMGGMKEAIGIARSYHQKHRIPGQCWVTKPHPNGDFVNFSHTESASFKASGIWVVTARTEWGDLTASVPGGLRKLTSNYITD